MKKALFLLLLSAPFFLFFSRKKQNPETGGNDSVHYAHEKHFKNIRQLTFGADNAEAYWSFDGKNVCFQSNNSAWGLQCDQIFYMPVTGMDLSHGEKPKRVSTGDGRTTCAFFMPDGKSILYASTHLGGKECPREVERKPGGKYLWPIYDSYDIFVADLNGKIIKQLTNSPGYDAEATISPKKDKIVFTSMRHGDLDLYTMDMNGKNVKQITHELGYDGGAFFSPDGTKIVFRASRFTTDEEKKEYVENLKQGLVAPTSMEIFVCNVDGSDLKQVTHLGKANWAPFYHPSGKKIIFSSNHKGKRGFQFNLFMINEDGSALEQISHDTVFDSFPMFSPDGKKIVFSSNRNNGGTHNTNLFVADWVD
ncbi:MAG: SGNH/GDSL hydrolase family protein [Cytophagales bacterium]|jgi:Tol biopolymer transport system component|nr:PD40 domain-containing protein [Bacteroidota bacterium]MBS1979581.1 PD40 domain-containing protein [Bacteroidota bacterium]WHZ09218.1 MAG: SGNH/GDSL hydrolase family protein [Cytophagales bacterium]